MKNFSTGRLGRLFNVVIPESCNRGSQPLKDTTRFPITTFGNDVRRGHIGGFTLIELLVVVLIIGILAAIALPQYEMAVAKTRVAQILVRMNALKTGMTSYFLANGVYPNDVTLLDVDIYSNAKRVGKTSISGEADRVGVEWKDGSECTVSAGGSLGCTLKKPQGAYFYMRVQEGIIYCRAVSDFEIKLCKALGGGTSKKEIDGSAYYLLP